MTSYFEAFKDLLFPPFCLGCERWLESSRLPLFCSDCLSQLAVIQAPNCRCCGVPFLVGADHLCGDCLTAHYAFDLARSLWPYQPPVSTLIHALKFQGNLTGLATLGWLAAGSDCIKQFVEPDLIVPVPLFLGRLRERGFNQALVIAQGCFPQWRNRIDSGVLFRTRATVPQSSLSGKERRRNLHKAFSLSDFSKVKGKRILLVDDVFTTGSTINECCKTLRLAGAARIECFTLARSLVRGSTGPAQVVMAAL
ncbi:MAG: ComF family protein [Desulfobulbaceae bacterium]|nr:ComF family protein [Desulfobulbaceae bacterium]